MKCLRFSKPYLVLKNCLMMKLSLSWLNPICIFLHFMRWFIEDLFSKSIKTLLLPCVESYCPFLRFQKQTLNFFLEWKVIIHIYIQLCHTSHRKSWFSFITSWLIDCPYLMPLSALLLYYGSLFLLLEEASLPRENPDHQLTLKSIHLI